MTCSARGLDGGRSGTSCPSGSSVGVGVGAAGAGAAVPSLGAGALGAWAVGCLRAAAPALAREAAAPGGALLVLLAGLLLGLDLLHRGLRDGGLRPREARLGGDERRHQQRDEGEPTDHRTSVGRWNADALGMIPAASTSSHCSSSEQ